jgi:transposase
MKTYYLSSKQLNELWSSHQVETNKRSADRIKAIYLLGKGWSVPEVATALLLSENSIRNYYEVYSKGGISDLLATHYESNRDYLTEEEQRRLEEHLEKVVYLRVEDVVRYVKKTFKVTYSINGMRDLLHRLDFVYKKPKLSPAKVNRQRQQRFLRKYEEIQASCGEKDRIYFVDATHPHYQTVAGFGWIKRGKEVWLPTTVTQEVLNINGAIDVQTLKGVFEFQEKETLTQEATADLLVALRKQQPQGWIYLISDRGRCFKNKAVREFAKGLAIKIIYLPPYSPNLNLIERLWRFFRKEILYNRRYETFEDFCQACKGFFKNIPKYKKELRTLLAENFQIIPE